MFVGHCGPSYAARALDKRIPLWLLFLAVQFLDVLWSVLVLLGVEKVRIVPGITSTNALDLYYMPYTHGLIGALGWSVVAGAAYTMWRPRHGWRPAGFVSAAVFSHWVLDCVAHRPDMPLIGDGIKIGLGSWNYPLLNLALEGALLFGGMFLYWRATKTVTRAGVYGMPLFGIAILAVQTASLYGPPPASDRAAAITALVAYGLMAAGACVLDTQRV